MHTGFWKSWESVATATLDGVQKAHQAYPGFKLAVTGHSFGGAVGTLAATVLRNSGSEVALVSVFSWFYGMSVVLTQRE